MSNEINTVNAKKTDSQDVPFPSMIFLNAKQEAAASNTDVGDTFELRLTQIKHCKSTE